MVLCFGECYYKSIIEGVKTVTVSLVDKGLTVGDVVVLSFKEYGKNESVGWCECFGDVHDLVARVVNVGVYQFRFLDSGVAYKMGFRSVGLLWGELLSQYPSIVCTDLVYVYEFELV